MRALAAALTLSAVAAAAAPRSLQSTYGGGWPTEHADARNSGQSAFYGPDTGDCRSVFFRDAINVRRRRYARARTPNPPRAQRRPAPPPPHPQTSTNFFSTGVSAVSTSDNSNFANAHVFGGSDNVFRIVNKFGSNVSEWACPLSNFGKSVVDLNYGLVASPVAWAEDNGVDSFALASADGSVYAVDWQGCTTNQTVCKFSTFSVPSVIVGATSGGGVRGAGELDISLRTDARCLLWRFVSPKAFPFLSPPRHITAEHPLSPTGMVLVADTAPGSIYTGGTLYALHPVTGVQLWNFSAIDAAQKWWGLVGVAPAWDSSANGAIYVGFGQGVVALDPETGKVVGRWEGAGDVVVASPVLIMGDAAAAAVVLHTTLGSVWSLAITGNTARGGVWMEEPVGGGGRARTKWPNRLSAGQGLLKHRN